MSRASSTPRGRVGLARAALVAVIGLVALLAAPGAASATSTPVTVLFDCVQKLHGQAGWIALFGYSNMSSSQVSYPIGPANVVQPAESNGDQPTTFEPGTHRGVFALPFKTGNSAVWTISGRSVTATMNSKTCPPSTELPEDGNGTGPAIVLVGAGVIGAVAVHRARRRASAAAPVGERDDA
jgi:hypothetical protein